VSKELSFSKDGQSSFLSLLDPLAGLCYNHVTMMTRKHLGEVIRRARLGKGLSPEELAARVGCSLFALRQWERGKTVPIRIFRRRLEEELEIDLSEWEGADER